MVVNFFVWLVKRYIRYALLFTTHYHVKFEPTEIFWHCFIKHGHHNVSSAFICCWVFYA
jgi:uncharacterized membrane protein YjgN (DUF898 family)